MNLLNWFGVGKMTNKTNNVLNFPEVKGNGMYDNHTDYDHADAGYEYTGDNREHYRIGYNSKTRMASLTLIDEYGQSISTLNMNQPAAEQLIRMLRASFPE